MSDTPRVDEAILKSNGQWSYALVYVARQLERELAQAMEKLADSEVRNLRLNRIERELEEAIKQRDEAEFCLLQMLTHYRCVSSIGATTFDIKRWCRAAGMEDEQ